MIKLCMILFLALNSTFTMASQVQQLGDSEQLGLDEKGAKASKPPEKISSLGDGAYVRQYNEFGQPMVEVHPEVGPSYYYNENDIREPNPDDGVMDRQTPSWLFGQW